MKEILGDQKQSEIKTKEKQKEKNSSDEESDDSDFDESGSNDDENYRDEYLGKKKDINVDKKMIIDHQ